MKTEHTSRLRYCTLFYDCRPPNKNTNRGPSSAGGLAADTYTGVSVGFYNIISDHCI